jgi:hypothetical protein
VKRITLMLLATSHFRPSIVSRRLAPVIRFSPRHGPPDGSSGQFQLFPEEPQPRARLATRLCVHLASRAGAPRALPALLCHGCKVLRGHATWLRARRRVGLFQDWTPCRAQPPIRNHSRRLRRVPHTPDQQHACVVRAPTLVELWVLARSCEVMSTERSLAVCESTARKRRQ